MDKIWYRNPSKSEVIGRCGGDEKNESNSAQWHTLQTSLKTPKMPPCKDVSYKQSIKLINTRYCKPIILAFDFCQFCVVIRFFPPRHNGQ